MLTPIVFIEDTSFSVRSPDKHRRRFKYRAGAVVEVHPVIAAKLVAAGLASANTTAEANPKATASSSCKPLWLTDTEEMQLEFLEIGGVENRLIYAVAKLEGGIDMEANTSRWVPTDVAGAAIEAGAAVALRWPENAPDNVPTFRGSQPVQIAI